MRAAIALVTLGLAACSGESGTLTVGLITAPGSTILDGVATLHVTLTAPMTEYDVPRVGSGFDLAFDVTATGSDATILIDGVDANGALVAVGASPPLPIAAVTSNVVIYLAAPLTLAAAPLTLTPARSALGVGTLPYGAILVGGLDGSGSASDAVEIYNVYDHSVSAGLALPSPLGGIAVGVGETGYVYLFGGDDGSGSATGDLLRFDTTVAPSGMYTDLGNTSAFARAGQEILPLGDETFAITGTPVLDLSGIDGTLVSRTDIATLPATGVTVTGTDGIDVTLIAGDGAGATGIESLRADVFTSITADGAIRTGHAVVAGPTATTVIVIGGMIGTALTADALIIDSAASTTTTVTGALATPRTDAAVAVTARHVVVAGGLDANGAVVATAEILDATTLARIATVPMVVPRTGANAVALDNGQVLIAGGVDASGAPIATLELFTPDDPPQ